MNKYCQQISNRPVQTKWKYIDSGKSFPMTDYDAIILHNTQKCGL